MSNGVLIVRLTHNYHSDAMPLLRLPIIIHADAWIAAESFVGPGVTIGSGVILGARAVAMKDLDPMFIYAGNPAKPIKKRPSIN